MEPAQLRLGLHAGAGGGLLLGRQLGAELTDFLLEVLRDRFCHQVVVGGLGERDVVGEGNQLVYGKVLLGYQLSYHEGWRPGEELVPRTVELAMGL